MVAEVAFQERWSKPERWAWEQIRAGQIPNFNKDKDELDPRKPDGWNDERKLSPEFLKDILLREAYRSAIPITGVRIIGAWFREPVDLAHVRLDRQLWLRQCRFEREVNLRDLRVDGWLSFGDSAFVVDPEKDLASLDLSFARINGWLAIDGALVAGNLDMESLEVKQHLTIRSSARFQANFKDVNLSRAKVDGQLDLTGAHVAGTLHMGSLEVKQNLRISSGSKFQDVYLAGAKVDGELTMVGATFEGGLDMKFLTVGRYLVLHFANCIGEVSLAFAKVGFINLGGSSFSAPVDATGLTVEGELTLIPPPTWADKARFVLRNAHVGALNDGRGTNNPWPEEGKLVLDGFSYSRLGGFTEVSPRQVRWYIHDWLARDTSYTPQPYHQLAGVLRAHGDPSAANTVLYAARERERTEAWKGIKAGTIAKRVEAWLRWLGLSLLNRTIGYGLGGRYFRVLIWVVAFTLIGGAVLWYSGADKVRPATAAEQSSRLALAERKRADEAQPITQEHALPDPKPGAAQANPELRKGVGWCLWASLDWMLPFIELDKAYTQSIAKLQGGPFYWLYVQALAGYVLAGFLAAGLAGLTQKS